MSQLFEKADFRNGSLGNALYKMMDGYALCSSSGSDTCYRYVGIRLKERNIQEATIRFWGLVKNNLIVHGDAILPSGEIISDSDPALYKKKGYELVAEMPVGEFIERFNKSEFSPT